MRRRMRTYNEVIFPCTPQEAYLHAVHVERWPIVLPHYRWVRFIGPGLVEMAARRDFGRFGWPVWWVSRMTCDNKTRTVRYTHVDGVTRGMEVVWQVDPAPQGSRVTIRHDWEDGPRFAGPAGRALARHIIGPVFVHYVADQTLTHLCAQAKGG